MVQTQKCCLLYSCHRNLLEKFGGRWILFFLFALVLFSKNVSFHWIVNHSLLISSIFHNPLEAFYYYMPKLSAPLFIACFIFLTRRIWWTFVVSIFLDVWCVSNVVYYKSYDTFITFDDISLLGNIDQGTMDSILCYFGWWILFFVLPTCLWILYCLVLCVFSCTLLRVEKKNISFASCLLFAFFLPTISSFLSKNSEYFENRKYYDVNSVEWASNYFFHEEKSFVRSIPYIDEIYCIRNRQLHTCSSIVDHFVKHHSIMSSLGLNLVFLVFSNDNNGPINLNKNTFDKFIYPRESDSIPQNHLVVILVESFESWPLEKDIEGHDYAPNLKKLLAEDHVLYCPHIKNQTKKGNSGDGQMIINTGLLPTIGNVACMTYGNNKFPNFSHLFPYSTIINPWPHIWNQDTMSIRYGYKNKIERSGWDDKIVLDTAYDLLKSSESPTCIFAITISMHSPFDCSNRSMVESKAPPLLGRYLNCLEYTDSCIGSFMDKVKSDPALSQSTIVITGDHTIFKTSMIRDFKEYAERENLSIKDGETYCPLIIYSPNIEGNFRIEDYCFQSDIFPTILDIINCEGYFWHGLGESLLPDSIPLCRRFSEQETFDISDYLIKMDYFNSIR